MSASIVSYSSIKDDLEVLKELREIFFESSTRKVFKDEIEKDHFYFKYVGFYLTQFPDLAWVAQGENGVLGYVVAAPNSSQPELQNLQPHLSLFSSEFKNYPGHLHINCHFESRGQGVGKLLVLEVINEFRKRKIQGLHIMTGPASQNRNFYKKLGFEYEVELNFQGSPILFMGKSLSENNL